MELLLTLANLLNLTGFFVRDRIWVRALSFSAALLLAMYFAVRPAMYAQAAFWNAVFLALHGVFLVRLAVQRLRSRD